MTQLKVSHLQAGYRDTRILKDITFSVAQQEMIAVLGRNGCGKTTLLKAIAGGILHQGHVVYDNQDLDCLSIKQRARLISFLTQRFQVIEGISVKELIQFGQYSQLRIVPREELDASIRTVSKKLSIDHLLKRDYVTLSEGQKQMVQLAKILVQDTPVILMDEPDSALDFDNRHFLYQFLKQLVKEEKKAALVVLHDPIYALNYFDKIILLESGMIADVIDHDDPLSLINAKIQKIYPDLTVEYHDQTNQFYTLFKENK